MKKFNLFKEIITAKKSDVIQAINSGKTFAINYKGEIKNPPYADKEILIFEGKHDFSYFIKTGSITHTNVREIYKVYYRNYKNYHLIYFEANGFLRSQVRMMVDFAMQVALEQQSLKELEKQLNLEKRWSTKLAPAEGLYLARIGY